MSIHDTTLEIMAYRELLRLVLGWRGLDGDGITDPLREQIRATLAYYAAPGPVHAWVVSDAPPTSTSTEHPDAPDRP
jgi:hypothetical protein